MINKLILILLITVLVLIWPENESPIGLILFISTVSIIFIYSNNQFCFLLTSTFFTSYLNSYYLYNTKNKYDLFRTSTQDQHLGMTDSQFFLYIAEQIIKTESYDMLLWTWGSLIPTLFGTILLYIFNLYYAIVFFNCLLYISSILTVLKIFKITKLKLSDILIISILPLSILYNSMLSKEPIFLYLVCLGISLISRINLLEPRFQYNNLKLLLIGTILLLFRPIGFVILGGLYLFRARFIFLIKKLLFVIVFLIIVIFLLLLIDYPLPLFFLNKGSFDMSPMIAMQKQLASIKEIPTFLHNYIIPPYSFLLFPLLLLAWFLGPLINIGTFYLSIEYVLNYGYTFSEIINILKFIDLFIILFFFIILIKNRNLTSIRNIYLIILPLFIILFFIVTFNFLESSRHKYFSTIFIFLLYKISFYFNEQHL